VLFYETDETGAYLAKSGNSRTELVSVDVASGAPIQYTPQSNEVKLAPQWLPGGSISYAVRGNEWRLGGSGIPTAEWSPSFWGDPPSQLVR